MPLPTPHEGEGHDEWMSRCMGHRLMNDEYPDEGQRYAVCESQWQRREADMTTETRAAIPSHSTATSTGAWDGPANEARLRSDGDAAYYRKAFAWVDSEADPDTKSAYRFIHHEVAGEGQVGAANMKACSSAMGVLNGGRGGTTIPAGDREGVHAHLARHMMDGDMEPPPLRSEMPAIEKRMRDLNTVELRIEREDGRPRISGHGAIFNSWSEPIGGQFREKILPGAFSKTLRESADIFSLFNHNPDNVLGRTLNSTLELREDGKGLWFRATPPENDPMAASVLAKIEGGYITGNSFAFAVVKDSWGTDQIDGQSWQTRQISELRLFEVGPVTFPAYPETDVAVRQLIDWEQRIGRRLQGKRLDQLAKIAQDLTEFITWARSEETAGEGGDENNSASSRPEGHSAAARERLRRRLDARIRAA